MSTAYSRSYANMAPENLQTIFNALPQLFDEDLHRQWNRTTYMMATRSGAR